ncbi:MAG TPA: hypothetical protein VJV78_32885 [Polyangiales bacterium]|nr:hypothetical protein [Polyangiales bacterium]
MGPASAADDEPFRLDSAPNAVALYWVENIAVMAWHEMATAPVIEALHASAADRRERYPSGMSYIHIGRVELAMMDSATRGTFVRIAKELGTYSACTAIVTQASGFWASTLRSIVTGIRVLSGTPSEIRFHEKVEEVLEWLPEAHSARTGVKIDLDRLRRVLLKAGTVMRE